MAAARRGCQRPRLSKTPVPLGLDLSSAAELSARSLESNEQQGIRDHGWSPCPDPSTTLKTLHRPTPLLETRTCAVRTLFMPAEGWPRQ
jgi:hypothetical protein